MPTANVSRSIFLLSYSELSNDPCRSSCLPSVYHCATFFVLDPPSGRNRKVGSLFFISVHVFVRHVLEPTCCCTTSYQILFCISELEIQPLSAPSNILLSLFRGLFQTLGYSQRHTSGLVNSLLRISLSPYFPKKIIFTKIFKSLSVSVEPLNNHVMRPRRLMGMGTTTQWTLSPHGNDLIMSCNNFRARLPDKRFPLHRDHPTSEQLIIFGFQRFTTSYTTINRPHHARPSSGLVTSFGFAGTRGITITWPLPAPNFSDWLVNNVLHDDQHHFRVFPDLSSSPFHLRLPATFGSHTTSLSVRFSLKNLPKSVVFCRRLPSVNRSVFTGSQSSAGDYRYSSPFPIHAFFFT